MALPVFTPPVAPQVGSGSAGRARTRDLAYGDGYSQHTGDGLNAVIEPVTLVWSSIDPTHAKTIVDFMRARKGAAFTYIPPRETVARQFRCPSWQRPNAARTRDGLTLNLLEDFNLG